MGENPSNDYLINESYGRSYISPGCCKPMKPSLLTAGIYPRRAYSGISSEMNMHATTTVWLGLKLKNCETLFLNKVPATSGEHNHDIDHSE